MVELEDGRMYYVREDNNIKGMSYVADLVERGYKALCFVRKPPEQILKDSSLEKLCEKDSRYKDNIKFVRLIYNKITTVNNGLDVKDISKISAEISKFFEQNEKAVVYIGCLEFLAQANNVDNVQNLKNHVQDIIIDKNKIGIMSINPDAYEKKDFTNLVSYNEELKGYGKTV
jgi:hypothetical protein